MQELIRLRRASLSGASLTDATPSRASTPPLNDSTTESPTPGSDPVRRPASGSGRASAPIALSSLAPQAAQPAPPHRTPRLKPKPAAAAPASAAAAGARCPGGQERIQRSRSVAALQGGGEAAELEDEVTAALDEGLVSIEDVHVYGKRTHWEGAPPLEMPCGRGSGGPPEHAPRA